MLHDSYLFNPHAPDLLLQRTLPGRFPAALSTPRLVVPRALCAYHRVDCSGVPRLRTGGFAQLQVQALSPFSKFGSCVVRQGDWLHIWIWDAAIESAFAEKHGGRQGIGALAYSLYSTPAAQGIVWLSAPGTAGVEAQLWKNRQLVDSLWFDQLPDPQTWASMRVQNPALQALGWPDALPRRDATERSTLARRPWGRNLTARANHHGQIRWSQLAPVALVLATAGLAGWGSWLYAQKEAHQQAIDLGLQSQERLLAKLEPLQEARKRTNDTLGWINAVQALSPPPTTHDIITELAEIVTRQGLAVRELEVNPPTVQATLVVVGGGSPRLTGVLGALENHPWFYDARFVDVSGGTGFKFAWRIRPNATASTARTAP